MVAKSENKLIRKIEKAKKISDLIRGLNQNEKLKAFEVLANHFLSNEITKESEYSLQIPSENVKKFSINTSSFVTFLKKLKIKSQADKVLAAAYVCLQEGKKEITLTNIKDKYEKALLKKSKNFNAEINSNIAKGYMMQNEKKIEAKKSYSITQEGIEYLQEKFKKRG